MNMSNSIGKQIRAHRRSEGWSQNDLRDKLGVKSTTTIQNWESDRILPDLKTIEKITHLFGWVFLHPSFCKNK